MAIRIQRLPIDGLFDGRAFAVAPDGVVEVTHRWDAPLFFAFVKEARRIEAFYWLRFGLRCRLEALGERAITAGGAK